MAGAHQQDSGRLLTGWGRTTLSRAKVVGPLPGEQLQALVTARPAGGVLARGAGRSYGDAAQNAGGVVVHPEIRRLTPDRDPEGFRATVGGMGLTGVILGAMIRLLRIRSARMLVSTRRMADLDALLTAVDEATDRYCVAWIDTTATGRSFGRGIVEVGDHLADPDPAAEGGGLAYRPHRPHRAPPLPVCPFTAWSAREFNGLHFRTAARGANAITDLAAFFHRLDALDGWNCTLGPRGFVEYQCVVPEGAHGVIAQILEAAQRQRCAPFLGTLRRFGPESGSYLSYPLPGWSVSIDVPAGNRQLAPMLDDLDLRVAAAGGRVDLAGDSRLSGRTCAAMYPRLAQWRAAASRLDPAGVFRSDLGQRLGLRRAGAKSPGRQHAG